MDSVWHRKVNLGWPIGLGSRGCPPEDQPLGAGRRLLLKHTAIAGGAQPIGAVRNLPVGDRSGRLYVPTGASTPGPLLVFFHGGGWVYGDLDSHDPPCRFLAERSRVRVLSVDYRSAPEPPFPARDGAPS